MRSKRITILNTNIDVLSFQETIQKVNIYIMKKKPLHLMGVNADKINMLHENERLKSIVNSCEIINADGASVILASRYLGVPLPERIAGVDLMIELIKIASDKEYSIFLLGAAEEVVNKTKEVLQKKYPNLKIAGLRNGYFKKEQWIEVASEIRESNAKIVFVGMTSPLKEYLVDYFQNIERLNNVFMGVGGSFDVISGKISRAPLWMQKANLEWLFRLMQEPRRLFKRYFVGNCIFIYRVYIEKRRNNKNACFNGRG